MPVGYGGLRWDLLMLWGDQREKTGNTFIASGKAFPLDPSSGLSNQTLLRASDWPSWGHMLPLSQSAVATQAGTVALTWLPKGPVGGTVPWKGMGCRADGACHVFTTVVSASWTAGDEDLEKAREV